MKTEFHWSIIFENHSVFFFFQNKINNFSYVVQSLIDGFALRITSFLKLDIQQYKNHPLLFQPKEEFSVRHDI